MWNVEQIRSASIRSSGKQMRLASLRTSCRSERQGVTEWDEIRNVGGGPYFLSHESGNFVLSYRCRTLFEF